LRPRIAGFCFTHPITNATSESINAKIQWVKYIARPSRNQTLR
jgi:transposase